jgi:hypothetical protein
MNGRVLVPLTLIGMLAIPGLELGRIYSGDLLVRLVLVAAIASVMLSVLVRRRPPWTAAPVSVLGLVAMALVSVKLSAGAGQITGALPDITRDALRNSIPRLLTALIPIQPEPDTVLVPVITTWLAGLAGAELAVRYGRVMLAYVLPTALLGGALYLVGPNAKPTLWMPVAFAGFAAIGLAASSRRTAEGDRDPELSHQQRTTLRLRIGAGAAAGLAIIVVLSSAVGPTVADKVGNVPTDPRRYVTPPQLDSLDENPLVRLSGWALNPDQRLFDADVTGAGAARIRLAVVSDYDGVTWRVGATYRNAGRVLTGPPADSTVPKTTTVLAQKITIGELDGRLLPGAATPAEVDGVRIAFDQSTGTMAVPSGLHPGLSYTVLSDLPKPDVNLLPAAGVPKDDASTRFLALPGKVPDQIIALAQQIGAGLTAPYQRAQAIEDFLAQHYALVTDAPSGHAYPNVNFFLFGQRNAGGQKGTSEQFSAAFAVLARELGLPTRIAVGFTVKSGVNHVRGADALAWPEVLFNGLGWVDFNPLPQPNTKPRPVEDDFRPPANPTNQPTPTTVENPSTSASAKPKPSASAAPTAPGGGPPLVTVALVSAGGLVGALLIGWCLTVPMLRRRLRRRRIAAADPSDRVTGAWLEVLDGLRMAGKPALPHLAATEVVGFAAAAAGRRAHDAKRGALPPAPPINDLAAFANSVAFGPPRTLVRSSTPPVPSAAAASDEQARRAVAQAIAYVGELRARKPIWRRLLWTVDPRPLRWARSRR